MKGLNENNSSGMILSSGSKHPKKVLLNKIPMILAFSGFVNEEIRQKAYKFGFLEIIEAPLSQDKIKDIILGKYYEIQEMLKQLDQENPLLNKISSGSLMSRSLYNDLNSMSIISARSRSNKDIENYKNSTPSNHTLKDQKKINELLLNNSNNSSIRQRSEIINMYGFNLIPERESEDQE